MVINKDFIVGLSERLNGLQDREKRKLEFKREWYDLSGNNLKDIEEFCKDITAMANTPGPEGHILIGIDESNGNLINSPISESKVKDNEIANLIIKRVTPPIQFEMDTVTIDNDTVITVIKVPPSLEKPHVMGVFTTYKDNNPSGQRENFIPIRYGTSIFPANHTDLEYMYYDRKNIIHDYDINVLPLDNRFAVNAKEKGDNQYITITFRYLLHNIGMHPIALNSVVLNVLETDPIMLLHDDPPFTLIGYEWAVLEQNINARQHNLSIRPIIVPHNQLLEIQMTFWCIYIINQQDFDSKLREFRAILRWRYNLVFESSNGRSFTTNTFGF